LRTSTQKNSSWYWVLRTSSTSTQPKTQDKAVLVSFTQKTAHLGSMVEAGTYRHAIRSKPIWHRKTKTRLGGFFYAYGTGKSHRLINDLTADDGHNGFSCQNLGLIDDHKVLICHRHIGTFTDADRTNLRFFKRGVRIPERH